jgi:hypothetical protein
MNRQTGKIHVIYVMGIPEGGKREKERESTSQAPVAHTCNPSYSGGRYQEDQG